MKRSNIFSKMNLIHWHKWVLGYEKPEVYSVRPLWKRFWFWLFKTLPKAWIECLMRWICVVNNTTSQQHISENKQKCAHHTCLLKRTHPLATGICVEAWANRRVLCQKRRTILNHHSQIIVDAQNFLGFKHFSHANWQPMTTFNAEIMMRSIGTNVLWDITEWKIYT